tara:strand:+ start:3041 stop:3790 length:750 start_codon:yes stop_codon:yes gene_type:complete
MDNHFKVIIPLYNVEDWIAKTIKSVQLQNYDNYECILVDDISTDKTSEVIKAAIAGDDRFKLVTNTEKSYALKNIHDTIQELNPDDQDIILTLDGDDWLASRHVLSKINEVYNESGCWMTYGSYVEHPSNVKGQFSRQIPKSIIYSNAYRESPWCSSHLRTFKCGLWRKINKKDLINDETGRFVKAAWDLAFMFPMLEMSGEKAVYVKDIMYVYNRTNPLNEDKINHSVQLGEERMIRNRKKYSKVDSL